MDSDALVVGLDAFIVKGTVSKSNLVAVLVQSIS